ncbi:hypothetical protein V8C34DRAFT_325230 [Trichoderma compactum]
MDTFNHFRIKCQAHNISRQSNPEWNPFRHVSWKPKRAETWNRGQLEAQAGGNDEEEGLTHKTAIPYPISGNVRGSTSGAGQGTDGQASHAVSQRKSEDSHDIPLINRNSLRNRKGECDDTIIGTPRLGKPTSIPSFFRHVKPQEPFTVANQLQRIFFESWLNLLLPLAPAGIAHHVIKGNTIETFIVNFFATFPLENMAAQGLDEIQLRLGKIYENLLYPRSINGLATTAQLSRTFIGLVLLPIPNCDPYAIYLAIKDEVDHVITCTIGKCIQTALCITPFITLLALWLDIQGVTLVLDGFEIVSLFAAILLLDFVVSPGKDHW